jgi:thiamine-monophosphate kinase
MTRPGRLGEFEIIERYFAPLSRGWPGAFSLADDGAVIAPRAGHELVVTADALIEGVHFLPNDAPALVGRKLLRVNLSDLAAMGATPLAYLLTLAVSRTTDERWFAGVAEGLAADQAEFGVHLIGGDTTAGDGPAVLALTAFGEVPLAQALRRVGARPGDRVYATGTLGDGAFGLALRLGRLALANAGLRRELEERYLLPRPRIETGSRLRGVVHAAIDVSDGLVADLGHLCRQSSVSAVIEAASLPLSAGAAELVSEDPHLLETVLTGGDDYELLFAAPADREARIEEIARETGVPITAVGRIEAGEGVRVVDRDGNALGLASAGFRHF